MKQLSNCFMCRWLTSKACILLNCAKEKVSRCWS